MESALKKNRTETQLAKRLARLIASPGICWFFVAHPEYEWHDLEAREAWESWLRKELTNDEFDLYLELYSFHFSEMQTLKDALLIDSNRMPQPGNIDGY